MNDTTMLAIFLVCLGLTAGLVWGCGALQPEGPRGGAEGRP